MGSRDVIGHVTIRLVVVDFLWVVHYDHASIWHRYRNMVPQSTCTHKHRTTDKTTNLLISSNVHYVYLAEIIMTVVAALVVRIPVHIPFCTENPSSQAQTNEPTVFLHLPSMHTSRLSKHSSTSHKTRIMQHTLLLSIIR